MIYASDLHGKAYLSRAYEALKSKYHVSESALARQVGGAGIVPQRKRLLEHRDGVLHGDEAGDIGFSEIERDRHWHSICSAS